MYTIEGATYCFYLGERKENLSFFSLKENQNFLFWFFVKKRNKIIIFIHCTIVKQERYTAEEVFFFLVDKIFIYYSSSNI